jgi:hypothetical protein
MRLLSIRTGIAAMGMYLLACSSIGLSAGRPELAVLSDAPAVEFSTGGWSYTNTSNPFLLTPDYLTNAMIGVSRLKPGQPFLKNGPIISEALTPEEMSKALAARLAGKNDLHVETLTIAGRDVAHASYTEPERNGDEYAFPFNGYVIHISLHAKRGRYYEEGTRVAAEILRTLRAH